VNLAIHRRLVSVLRRCGAFSSLPYAFSSISSAFSRGSFALPLQSQHKCTKHTKITRKSQLNTYKIMTMMILIMLMIIIICNKTADAVTTATIADFAITTTTVATSVSNGRDADHSSPSSADIVNV
jgi:hypothetical protein